MMKKNVLFGLYILLMLSCKKEEKISISYPLNIPFTTVAKGGNYNTFSKYPLGYKTTLTDSIQWNKVLSKLDSLILPTNLDIKIRNVDFNIYQLLSAIDTVRYGGGWTMDIISVKEYQNNIEVTFDNLIKANDATEIIQPYHIVRIPKQTKPIIYK